MGRPKGAKDKHPRKRWNRQGMKTLPLRIVKPMPIPQDKLTDAYTEGCYHIVELAKKKGEMLDLWITLDAFRRMKRL